MKRTTKTNDGITAIYVRRSVSDKDKGNNSLSISAQKEECIKFVGDSDYRIYCDDGKSGKYYSYRVAKSVNPGLDLRFFCLLEITETESFK